MSCSPCKLVAGIAVVLFSWICPLMLKKNLEEYLSNQAWATPKQQGASRQEANSTGTSAVVPTLSPSSSSSTKEEHPLLLSLNVTVGVEKLLQMTVDDVPAGVPMVHQILAYETVLTSTLCGVETLLRSVLSSNTANTTTTSSSSMAAILWVTNWENFVVDHHDWLDEMDQLLRTNRRDKNVVSDVGRQEQQEVYLIVSPTTLEKTLQGTPLWDLYGNASRARLGRFGNQNKANAMRLALTYKYGGMYMDTDMLWLKSPMGLPGDFAVVRQDRWEVNNALFRVPQQNDMLLVLMKNFVDNYDGNIWGYQGPNLFTRVFLGNKEHASPLQCKQDGRTSLRCKGGEEIILWQPEETGPLPYRKAKEMPNATRADFLSKNPIPKEAYCIHLWHKLSSVPEQRRCEEDEAGYLTSYIGSLRKEICPTSLGMVLTSTEDKFHCKF